MAPLGTRFRVFVIAEAGVNHDGDLEAALALVDAAAEAGADAVKFQTFRAESLVTPAAAKAAYQLAGTDHAESQFEMIAKLELTPDMHEAIAAHCGERGIHFLSTAFDPESLGYLLANFSMPWVKVPSGELTNPLLLLAAAKSGSGLLLSTGMADIAEIEAALGVLAFGLGAGTGTPGQSAFRAAFEAPAGRAALEQAVTLLHCTTEYPAPVEEVNLRAMDTMAEVFGLPVGYSDHTPGITVAIAAAARGAAVIEKHFTLDRSLPGPDHAASLEPAELGAMVQGIRDVESALGSADKAPAASEIKNIAIARKSLVALCAIAEGERFTEANLGIKRPGTGASPMGFFERLGSLAERDYGADELVK